MLLAASQHRLGRLLKQAKPGRLSTGGRRLSETCQRLRYQQLVGAVQLGPFCRGKVKGRQAHALADLVAQVGVEEERHASHTCNTSDAAR